jgi:membrane-associated protease RseP (regulator of RpoE activity)
MRAIGLREAEMEERKNLYAVVIAIAIVGLLLSCVAGALAGGVAGLLTGRRQAQLAAERALQEAVPEGPFGLMPWLEEQIPAPMPEQEEEPQPFEMPPMGMRSALVTQVLPDTPAEEAGLRAGDIITAVDRTPVDANHDLADVVAQYEPGDRVTLTIWRGGQSETIRVELGDNPDARGKPYLGIRYRRMGPNLNSPEG